jgi:uncharacterized protein (DUF1697 family)
MPKYIAFLRAINVGGHTLKMDDLKALFAELGFSKVETFIASGNVIFESTSKVIKSLEQTIEKHLQGNLGYAVNTFIRTDLQVSEIASYKPFNEKLLASSQALNIAFLKDSLPDNLVKTLLTLKTDIDDFHVNGTEIYWLCKQKQSDSKFSNAVLERTLKTQATFRGANTLARLAAKYPASKPS